MAMSLDDIDWEVGTFVVHGKGPRREPMLLPADVGQALTAYLSDGRPTCASRQLFVRLYAPYRGLSNASSVCDVVKRALALTHHSRGRTCCAIRFCGSAEEFVSGVHAQSPAIRSGAVSFPYLTQAEVVPRRTRRFCSWHWRCNSTFCDISPCRGSLRARTGSRRFVVPST